MMRNRAVWMIFGATCIALTIPALSGRAVAGGEMQTAPQEDTWTTFRFFIGEWEGFVDGRGGRAKVETSFKLILGDTFLQEKQRAVYDAQSKAPGRVHEHVAVLSFHAADNTYVSREFHVEGPVYKMVLKDWSPDGKRLVFISEAIEGIPDGFRARQTYRILGDDEYAVELETSLPGKDFVKYSQGRMRRVN